MVTSQKFNSGDFINLQIQVHKEDKESEAIDSSVHDHDHDMEDKESEAIDSNVHDHDHDNRIIKIYYSTTDVKVSEEIDIIDLATFVGSIGGNLGLFLGFSFLGLFNAVWDFLPQLRHGMMNYF